MCTTVCVCMCVPVCECVRVCARACTWLYPTVKICATACAMLAQQPTLYLCISACTGCVEGAGRGEAESRSCSGPRSSSETHLSWVTVFSLRRKHALALRNQRVTQSSDRDAGAPPACDLSIGPGPRNLTNLSALPAPACAYDCLMCQRVHRHTDSPF